MNSNSLDSFLLYCGKKSPLNDRKIKLEGFKKSKFSTKKKKKPLTMVIDMVLVLTYYDHRCYSIFNSDKFQKWIKG